MTPEFAKDFIAFQKGLKPLKRNVTGDDGKPYADLESVIAYARPRLAKHGFCFSQEDDREWVTTTIIHSSGTVLERRNRTHVMGDDGGARYSRRHSLMCALGLVEEPLPSQQAARARDVSRFTHDVFDAAGLNEAQITVLLNSGKTEDEMVDEANRLARGQK